jgi:hypothetical protein
LAAKLLQISEKSALSPVFLHKNVIDSRKTEYQEHNYAQNDEVTQPKTVTERLWYWLIV